MYEPTRYFMKKYCEDIPFMLEQVGSADKATLDEGVEINNSELLCRQAQQRYIKGLILSLSNDRTSVCPYLCGSSLEFIHLWQHYFYDSCSAEVT